MTIKLSDLSDAELGALVRKSMTQEAFETLVKNRPKALAKKAKKRAKENKRFTKERKARKAMKDLPALTVKHPLGQGGHVRLKPLSIADVDWHEEAPATAQAPYRDALALVGKGRDKDETLTWANLHEIHAALAADVESGQTAHENLAKVQALAEVLNITPVEAAARMEAALNTKESA